MPIESEEQKKGKNKKLKGAYDYRTDSV